MNLLRRSSVTSRDSEASATNWGPRASVTSRDSVKSRDSGLSSLSSSRATTKQKSLVAMLTGRTETHEEFHEHSDSPRSPSVASGLQSGYKEQGETSESFADRIKFADLIADKVVHQLRGSIKSSVAYIVGQAIDTAIAERLMMASCGLPMGKGFSQAGSSPISEDNFYNGKERVPTNGSLTLPTAKDFNETRSEASAASSFSSEFLPNKDYEKKKGSQMRRRNSIGTMERMLADNLFTANVYKGKAPEMQAHHSDKAEYRGTSGSTARGSAPAEEGFSTIPSPDMSRSANRKNSRKGSRSANELNGTKNKILDIQQAISHIQKPQVIAEDSTMGSPEVSTSNESEQANKTAVSHELISPPEMPRGKPEEKYENVDSFGIVPGGIGEADTGELPSEPQSPTKSPRQTQKKNSNGFSSNDVMKKMRQVHENELMENFISRKSQEIKDEINISKADSLGSMDSEEEWEAGLLRTVAFPRWLQLCGILPFTHCFFAGQGEWTVRCRLGSRTWYQLLVRVMVTLSFGFYIYEAVALTAEVDTLTYKCYTCLQAQLMSDMPLAFGSLLGLLFSDAIVKSNIIGSQDSLLVCFCRQEGLLSRWAKHSRLAFFETLFIWVCMVGERVRSSIAMQVDVTHTVLHVVGFAMITGVLMGLAYCLLHVCRALASMTDSFCSGFAECPCCPEAVRDWNVLQAVLRKVSYSVECVFLVLLTAALVAVCLPLLRHGSTSGSQSLLAVVPAALVLFSVARISFRAGAVTYKCDRVPALINSLTFGKDIDHERQYVINYILHSMAGFYVFEVRVTAEMVLKFAYVSGAVVFGVLTQLLS